VERYIDEPGPEIAYAEAVRVLSEQSGLVDSLRSRAGLLLSVAAIITSFLGSQSIRGDGVGPLAWLALCGFATASALCLAVLWPRHWEIAEGPGSPLLSPTDIMPGDLRSATLKLDEIRVSNEEATEDLLLLMQLASTAIAIDLFLWMIALAAS
jgi:hypothetical protein